jgi:2-polyprenyl-3-methyl-5-hydroxy-6-metoxy-1,4-benzoquinol methylase
MPIDPDRLNALLGKVVGDIGGAMSSALTRMGDQLGLFRALASGPATSAQLAQRAGVAERMVREWLLNQAASGYIEYDPAAGAFSMTPEQVAAFADETSPAFMGGAFDIIASVHTDAPAIAEAFRSGKGLPWGAHSSCLFCGTERFFAASYRANLIDAWLPALTGVVEHLRKGATVADVGCGHGASTLLMARAFPKSVFIGMDFHEPSIACARARAEKAGLRNVTFQVADATSFPAASSGKGYDLVTTFDCLHDMGDPVGCARRVRETLAESGVWMIVEPAAGDTVESNLNPVGRVFSAASTMICVPASMATGGPALGACAGEKRIGRVVSEGGLTKFRRAAETPFNFVFEAKR